MLLGAVLLTMGPAAADASIGYSLRYEGPRDAAAVEPLLAARLVRVGNAPHGYGYGYGYGEGSGYGYGEGSGHGYGYGYGYGGRPPRDDGASDALRFDDLAAGDYRLDGFADLDLDHDAGPEEPRGTGVDRDGSTTIRLMPGDVAHVDLVVREASSRVTGRVVSTEGAAIASASVTLIDRFGWTLRATSAPDGAFHVPDAPTGETYHLHYGIRVEAAGFETLETGLAHAVTRGSYDAGALALRASAPPADTTAPTLVSHAPEGGDVSENATVRLVFSEPMDRASVERALHAEPAIAGAFAWSRQAVELTPAQPLARNATYRVSIGADATDLAGNGLTPHAWSFTTQPAEPAPETPDATPPRVVSHAPVGDKVPPGKPVVIAFSEAMDRASVEAGLTVSPPLAAPLKVWWEDDALHVRGHRAMEHGTTYAVTLDGAVRDAQGEAMGTDHAWSFTTAPGPKPSDPGHGGHTPSPGPTSPPPNGPPGQPPAGPPASAPGNGPKTPPRGPPASAPDRVDAPAKHNAPAKDDKEPAKDNKEPAKQRELATGVEPTKEKEPAKRKETAKENAPTNQKEPAKKDAPAKDEKSTDATRGASPEGPGRGKGHDAPREHAKGHDAPPAHAKAMGHAKAPPGKMKGK